MIGYRVGIALVVLTGLLAGCGGGSTATPSSPAGSHRTHRPAVTATAAPRSAAGHWRHVVWIVMENKAYADALDPAQAPYTRGLADRYGLATDYHAITHPSLPNYLAMTSGSTHGVTDDDGPSAHPLPGPSLFSQVGDWRALQESMPSNCDAGDSGDYAVKHNPAAYFVALRDACGTRDVPLGSQPDVSARFSFLTPNLCNDTHDCPVSSGDRWLSRIVPALLASPQYRSGSTAIFITWDEDDGSEDNRVPAIVISPRTQHRRSATRYSHYSLLRTTEEMLGEPLLGSAKSAASMRAAFGL